MAGTPKPVVDFHTDGDWAASGAGGGASGGQRQRSRTLEMGLKKR